MDDEDDGYQSDPAWLREEDERQVLRVGVKDLGERSFPHRESQVMGQGHFQSVPRWNNYENSHLWSFVLMKKMKFAKQKEGEKDGRALSDSFVQPKLRTTQPMVKAYARGSLHQVEAAEQDEEVFRSAWEEFQSDKFANSNEAAVKSRKTWWIKRAENLNFKPFPVTTTLIDVAGALLKKGSYRSAHLYLQMMQRVHIEEGHSWSETLELAMKDAIRSCLRGKGPDKSCPSMDMRQLASISELGPIPGGPQRPRDTVILFAHVACREIEAALRIRSQIAVVPSEENCGVVSMFLPASKVDPKGCGVLGCSCKTSPTRVVSSGSSVEDHGEQREAWRVSLRPLSLHWKEWPPPRLL